MVVEEGQTATVNVDLVKHTLRVTQPEADVIWIMGEQEEIKWDTGEESSARVTMDINLGITISGYVYVVSMYNNRVQKFTSDGTFIDKWGGYGTDDGKFHETRGITADSSGNIYVVDTENHRIQKFTSDGTFITKWGEQGYGDGQLEQPLGIAVD